MGPTHVNVDTFVRAETDPMFAALAQQSGGTNSLAHHRTPTPLDSQTVIRMNRDTLSSSAIVDLSDGARLTVPESGDRYLSVMVVNQDHYINRIVDDAGDYDLTVEEFDTPYVLVACRVFVDPADPDDVAEVNALLDRFVLTAPAGAPFVPRDYDQASLDARPPAPRGARRHVDGPWGYPGRLSRG